MGRFIEIEGIEIDVIRKKGKKTLSLKIDRKSGRAQVSIPYLCPLFAAKAFVKAHIVWLQKNLETTPKKQAFENGMPLAILGQEVTIVQIGGRVSTHIENGQLIVGGTPEHLHRRVKDFICAQMTSYASIKAQQLAAIDGLKISRVTVRDTASRWGSCSSSHSLSFCWRLALAPAFVLDYVIAHEVAHLTHMNHAPEFWRKVKQMNADTARAQKWLKENSPYLHSFL